jgi:RHS repeat-associated protein
LTFSQTLNARQRPETLQLKNGAGSTLQSLTYGYSAAGDVTWILDGVDGADTVNNLTYDGLHRLKTASGIWGSYSYTYDGLNNLISRTGTHPLNYGYDAATNRLSGVSGAVSRNYGYNPRGGMIGDGTKSFTLNSNDQITNITGIASYGYDGNGKRIKTTKADGSVEYAFYDPSGTLMYVDRPGGSHTIYLSIDGNTIAELINWNPIYLHPDLLGSPRLGTNASGSTVWREHYGPYGEKLNGVNDKIGYTGHAYDAESQLTYAQARFYDPAVGRFMSMDPIGFTGNPASFTRYAYANNNPFAFTDPTGMASFDLVGLGDIHEGFMCGKLGSLDGSCGAGRGISRDVDADKNSGQQGTVTFNFGSGNGSGASGGSGSSNSPEPSNYVERSSINGPGNASGEVIEPNASLADQRALISARTLESMTDLGRQRGDVVTSVAKETAIFFVETAAFIGGGELVVPAVEAVGGSNFLRATCIALACVGGASEGISGAIKPANTIVRACYALSEGAVNVAG